MSEPSYRLETIRDGYAVIVGHTRRLIHPLADGTGRWFVLGWAGIDFPSVEAAAQAVANQLTLPGVAL